MKKFFILIVFFLTTGFLFKTDLERCADYEWKKESFNVFPKTEYKIVRKSEAQIIKLREEKMARAEKAIQKYKNLPICKNHDPFQEMKPVRDLKCRNNNKGSGLTFEELKRNDAKYLSNLEKYDSIKIRDISQKETDAKIKKFINKNLKQKLQLADTVNEYNYASDKYNIFYKNCIAEKKKNPTYFKSKY